MMLIRMATANDSLFAVRFTHPKVLASSQTPER